MPRATTTRPIAVRGARHAAPRLPRHGLLEIGPPGPRLRAVGGQIKLRIREYNGATLVNTGTTTVNPTGDWQQVTLSYTVVSPGSTLDLNVYETNQPAGSDLLVDDVTLKSG